MASILSQNKGLTPKAAKKIDFMSGAFPDSSQNEMSKPLITESAVSSPEHVYENDPGPIDFEQDAMIVDKVSL